MKKILWVGVRGLSTIETAELRRLFGSQLQIIRSKASVYDSHKILQEYWDDNYDELILQAIDYQVVAIITEKDVKPLWWCEVRQRFRRIQSVILEFGEV